MQKLFITDATDLIAIIENADECRKPSEVIDVTNDWVNIILRETGKVPVHKNDRSEEEKYLFEILSQEDIQFFEDTLIQTLDNYDTTAYGNPTVHHMVIDKQLLFYINRG